MMTTYETEVISNLTVLKFDRYTEAVSEAYQQASQTFGEAIPVVLFKQCGRWQLSGAMPFGIVSKMLYSQSADRKVSVDQAAQATNRPEDKKHTDEIQSYIDKNRKQKYILGALTLNIQQPLTLFTSKMESTVKNGVLVFPRSARISITDGQHRQRAISRLLESMPPEEAEEFANESMAVVITNELEMEQIHQDFADASKTKPLPPGLLAVYDSRNPANRVVLKLERSIPLFKGRIDGTSRSIGKNTQMLFTANQLRQFVKVFLTGNWQMGGEQFERSAFELLGQSDEDFDRELNKAVLYLNRLAAAIPVWKQIVNLSPGIPGARVADLRQKGFVCLSAAGLVILARIGHELFKAEVPNWEQFVDEIGKLDWSKEGALWQGNVVSADKKILVQQNLIRAATEKVRGAIGWVKPDTGDKTQPELALAV